MSDARLREVIAARGTNLDLVAALDQMLASGTWEFVQFWAYGQKNGEMIGNVGIGAVPSPGLTLEEAESVLAADFGQGAGISAVTTSRVQLPTGVALLFETSVTPEGAHSRVLAVRQYVIIGDDVAYFVNFTCRDRWREECLGDVEDMIGSLTIGP